MSNPVVASTRRMFEPIDPSDTTLTVPTSPRARTWVPPHSSTDGPASTTRTMSPYLSPKKASAPSSSAWALVVSKARTGALDSTSPCDQVLDAGQLVGGDRLVVREVEAEPLRGHQRTLLADVFAEHLPQRPVQQVGAGVVAADGVASGDVDPGRRLLAGLDVSLDRLDVMADQARAGHRWCR